MENEQCLTLLEGVIISIILTKASGLAGRPDPVMKVIVCEQIICYLTAYFIFLNYGDHVWPFSLFKHSSIIYVAELWC